MRSSGSIESGFDHSPPGHHVFIACVPFLAGNTCVCLQLYVDILLRNIEGFSSKILKNACPGLVGGICIYEATDQSVDRFSLSHSNLLLSTSRKRCCMHTPGTWKGAKKCPETFLSRGQCFSEQPGQRNRTRGDSNRI